MEDWLSVQKDKRLLKASDGTSSRRLVKTSEDAMGRSMAT